MLNVEMVTREKMSNLTENCIFLLFYFYFHARLIITKKEYTKTLSDIIVGIFSFIRWFALHH